MGNPTTLQPHEAPLLDHASAAPMLQQVEWWASVNSGTSNLTGLAQVTGLIADAFAALPGDIALVDPDPVEHVNPDGSVQQIQRGKHLTATVRPDAPIRVLLTGHVDTVFAADHAFQTLQWIDRETLNGPGTADMKGGIAVMLAALRTLEQSPLRDRLGYDVVLNSDEETGSQASARLIAQKAQGKIAALTYEPALADGTLAGARPGSGNFAIIIHGLAAHAGRNPQDGRNAIVAAADLTLRLSALAHPDMSVNPARIDGGGPNNVVPDTAIVRVNMRPRTPEAMLAAQSALADAVAAIEREHGVHCHSVGGFNRPPKPIDDQTRKLTTLVEQCGAALSIPISWKATGGVCDGNNIAACGVPVVDTMGPRGGAIHSTDEFLIVDSLAERARLSALTLLRIAEQGGL